MRVAVFSTKSYDRKFLEAANADHQHELTFLEPRLNIHTVSLAKEYEAICAFVNDELNAPVLEKLVEGGVKAIALRAAGFNNVDLKATEKLNLTIMRVPAYSPYAVAEHTVGLILALNRRIHRAYDRVREGNFSLDGLLGFDLHGRAVGIIGTGKIGYLTGKILQGFGCSIYAYDPYPNEAYTKEGFQYVDLNTIFRKSDIISLHCPLTPETYHLIDTNAIHNMKDGVMIINTSRGALINAVAAIDALKSGRIGFLGLDVYEEEADLFFEDLSNRVIQDDTFARLLTFPNVIVTGHQAFFTENALRNIADTTIQNLTEFESTGSCTNAVELSKVKKPKS